MKRRTVSILAAVAALGTAYSLWGPSGNPGEDSQDTTTAGIEGPRTVSTVSGETAGRPQQQTALSSSETSGCDIVSHYLVNEDGTATEVFSCEPNEEEPEHPYASYPDDALATLAYGDAKAAEMLSMRLLRTDGEAAMSLALRAAALSGGDATPVVAFANAYPQPTAIDGAPVRNTVHVKYVLSAVTELLGDPRHSAPYFEAIIREHSADPDREIALLDERARQIIEEMRQIQLDVTGSSTIGG